jgi:hypothetical protein
MSEVKCPECGHKMAKAGKTWSGRHKKQTMLCNKCGRRTVVAIDEISDSKLSNGGLVNG